MWVNGDPTEDGICRGRAAVFLKRITFKFCSILSQEVFAFLLPPYYSSTCPKRKKPAVGFAITQKTDGNFGLLLFYLKEKMLPNEAYAKS